MCDRVNVPERGQTVQDAGDLFRRRFALSIVWLFQETVNRRPLSDQVYVLFFFIWLKPRKLGDAFRFLEGLSCICTGGITSSEL